MKKRSNQSGFGVIEVIVVLVVVALIGVGGFYVWQKQTQKDQTPSTSNQQTNTSNPTPAANVFKINELGVEFIKKDDITPTYSIQDYTYNGVAHKIVSFTTQELTDKANAAGSKACDGFHLINLYAFGSKDDAVKAMQGRNVTAADMTPDKGYYTVGTRMFYVPRGIESGTGICLENGEDFESTQRVALRDSLATLRVTQ